MRFFSKIRRRLFGFGLCSNVNGTQFTRDCLLVYVAAPFLTKELDLGHQNQSQARELARVVGEFGFNVDVINFNEQVRLTKSYQLIIDLHPGLNGSYQKHLQEPCIKIAYVTGSNPAFSNRAEMQRLDDLYARKGERLQPRRQVPPFLKETLESFDAMMFIGNSYNLRTFDEFQIKRVFPIVNTGHPFLTKVDSSGKSARNFLFLASGGQVHKGLDLLLDFFAQHKELQLYICSDFKSEPDFCRLYHRELYDCDNIKAVGFIDIKSDMFRDICDQCAYVVLPSCSEANAGSILTGMSAGLIPIVSRECGFEEDEVLYFEDCTPEAIARTLLGASKESSSWICDRSQRSIDLVTERYSHERYSKSVRSALEQILDAGPAPHPTPGRSGA